MVIALGLDYTMGKRVDSPTVGREICKAMDNTFQEEKAALETPALTVSRGSTLEPVGSGECHCLSSLAPSHGGHSNFCSKEVWSDTVHVEDE